MSAQVKAIYPHTDINAVKADTRRVFALQKTQALALRRSSAAQRIAKLKKLRAAILDHRERIVQAIQADFGKPEVETELTEIMVAVSEANHAIAHLKKWMKPKRVGATKALLGTFSHIRYEPRGVTLLIAPWNFPFQLSIGPLISAIAAGNTVMFKPSEMTPATAALMQAMLAELFDENEVATFPGDASVSQALLELPFDHIFFTGSPAVGKIVMKAAAEHLTSVTLELGGKSPVVIDRSARIRDAARSIAFGKCQNGGQACISPDYVLIHESVHDEFVSEFAQAIADRYGATPQDRQNSPDLARIVNDRHHTRVTKLLDEALARGARTAIGGEVDVSTRFIAPTLLTDVPLDTEIMQEEIFGPVLPLVKFSKLDEAVDLINSKPKPLALYIYARDGQAIQRVLSNTSAGDSAINTCMVHFVQHNLPFGGVNNSGIGKAHGYHGFKAYSHERSVLRDRFAMSMLFAPPYSNFIVRLARLATRWLS